MLALTKTRCILQLTKYEKQSDKVAMMLLRSRLMVEMVRMVTRRSRLMVQMVQSERSRSNEKIVLCGRFFLFFLAHLIILLYLCSEIIQI